MRREAARLLFALSLNELNKLDVAGVGFGPGGTSTASSAATAEVATDLVALTRSDDPSCARNAVGALANLSENDATHERLLGWGASFLSQLALGSTASVEADREESTSGGEGGDGTTKEGGDAANGKEVGLVREATRCLANLAGNYAAHPKLLEGGAADALVGSLKREDAVTARFAALGISNLAGQVRVSSSALVWLIGSRTPKCALYFRWHSVGVCVSDDQPFEVGLWHSVIFPLLPSRWTAVQS